MPDRKHLLSRVLHPLKEACPDPPQWASILATHLVMRRKRWVPSHGSSADVHCLLQLSVTTSVATDSCNMNDETTRTGLSVKVMTVICQSCGCAIPLDVAVVPEALPYVVEFCGLDCYARWRAAATEAHIRTLPGA